MRLFVCFPRVCLGQNLSPLGRRLVAALVLCLPLLWSGVARGFDPAEVPEDFRGTFVNCLSKAQADPVAGWDYARQWLD